MKRKCSNKRMKGDRKIPLPGQAETSQSSNVNIFDILDFEEKNRNLLSAKQRATLIELFKITAQFQNWEI